MLRTTLAYVKRRVRSLAHVPPSPPGDTRCAARDWYHVAPSRTQRLPQYPASRPPLSRIWFDARTQRTLLRPRPRATAMMSTPSLEQPLDEDLRWARSGGIAG
jgi:hypothetical protein